MFKTLPVVSKKNIICFLSLIFLLILSGCQKSEIAAIKIGPVSVTQKEFDQAFQASKLPDNPDSRRAFMEQYVNQRLILIEAEQRGLDKDPAFLSEIQTFWEERLLKTSMLAKFEEYQPVIQANDEEVNQIYAESRDNKSLPQDPQKAKDQIRQMIAQEKQNKLLTEWLDSLRKKTNIYINEQQLGLKNSAG